MTQTASRFMVSLLATAVACVLSTPVVAGCSTNAPASGQQVTCTVAAPNPDTVGVQGGPGVADVRVTVDPDARVQTMLTPAISALASGWTLDNAGQVRISGSSTMHAVEFLQGGTVNNGASGQILGGFRGAGVFVRTGALQLSNAGLISGGRGVWVEGGASSTVINQAGGVIFGDRGGAVVFTGTAGHTLVNHGRIEGRVLFDAGDDVLTLGAGSVLMADAFGGGGHNTLNLEGTNTEDAAFSGFGQLNTRAGATWELTGPYAAGGDLSVDTASDARLRLGGPLTAGRLDKTGDGELEVAGDASGVTGPVQVGAGTLRVNGTLGGATTVAAGARLTGQGTVASLVNGGVVDPGNGLGTLTVTGDYHHEPTATLRVDLSPTASDRLQVGGRAILAGGMVQVVKVPGQYAGSQRYVLLNAGGGVAGQFAQLLQNMPFLDLRLAYDGNNVYLDIGRSQTRYAEACTGFDACQVAAAIDAASTRVGPATDLATVLDALSTLDLAGAQVALDSLAAGSHVSMGDVALEAARGLRAPGGATLLTDTQGAGVRLRGLDVGGQIGGANRANYDARGVALDLDMPIGEQWQLGGTFSKMRIDADIGRDTAQADLRGLEARARWAGDRTYASLAGGRVDVERTLNRRILVGPVRREASSKVDGDIGWLHGEFGLRLGWSGWTVQPFVDVLRERMDGVSIDEDGAGDVGLVGETQDRTRTSAALGARVGSTFEWGTWTVAPALQALWRHALDDDGGEFHGALHGAPSDAFSSRGVQAEAQGWQVDAAAHFHRTERLALSVGYGLYRSSDASSHALNAAVRWRW